MNANDCPHRYLIYGMVLGANRPVANLVEASTLAPVDVHITLEPAASEAGVNAPEKVSHCAYDEHGRRVFAVWKQPESDAAYLNINYNPDGGWAQFTISCDGRKLLARWGGTVDEEQVNTYLLGPVLGCLLRLRGVTPLHAGVVEIAGFAVAILGQKGAGKSTLVSSLAVRGIPVLADDIAALGEINGGFQVTHGYPRTRQWRQTLEALPGVEIDRLTRVLPMIEKYYIDLSTNGAGGPWSFACSTLPLGALYVVEMDDAPLDITDIPPGERLFTLAANTYADYLVEPADRAAEFDLLGRVARSVPLRRLNRPRRLEHLQATAELLLDDAHSLLTGSGRENR